jgi:hypothetical protein
MEPSREASPRFRARMAGLAYLSMFVAGGIATFGKRGLIVTDNPTATAANILAHQSMYILGYAGDVLVVATYVAVVALFYRIFKPVNKSVALVAAFMGLMGCATQSFTLLFEIAPLTLLGGAPFLGVFSPDQLRAFAFLSFKFYSLAYGVALVFFGLFDFLTGYLIYKSTFLPRFLGVFMMLGITGAAFLAPPFATKYVYFILLGAVGELLLTLWLLAKGVDEEKWLAQAAASRLAERG